MGAITGDARGIVDNLWKWIGHHTLEMRSGDVRGVRG